MDVEVRTISGSVAALHSAKSALLSPFAVFSTVASPSLLKAACTTSGRDLFELQAVAQYSMRCEPMLLLVLQRPPLSSRLCGCGADLCWSSPSPALPALRHHFCHCQFLSLSFSSSHFFPPCPHVVYFFGFWGGTTHTSRPACVDEVSAVPPLQCLKDAFVFHWTAMRDDTTEKKDLFIF